MVRFQKLMVKRCTGWFIISTLLSITILLLLLLSLKASAETITVDHSGNGDYTLIQKAIDAAIEGDTIRVWNGTYYENLRINKEIAVIGNGSETTTLKKTGLSTSAVINSDRVILQGFSILGRVTIAAEHTIVRDNLLNATKTGVLINRNHHSSTICNNTFTGGEIGIHVYYGQNITIENNSFSDMSHTAIHLERSIDCTILNNTMNRTGVSFENSYEPEYYDSHTFGGRNTVNGLLLGYYTGKTDQLPFSLFGQLILVNCTQINLGGMSLSNTSEGLIIAHSSAIDVEKTIFGHNTLNGAGIYYSNNIMITECTFQYNVLDGLLLLRTINSTVKDSVAFGNRNGMTVDGHSLHNVFRSINCYGNEKNGLYLKDSQLDTITSSIFENNQRGFEVDHWGEGGSIFSHCVIRFNTWPALLRSDNCLVEECSFENTTEGNGLDIWWGETNRVRTSSFVMNSGYGILVAYDHGKGQKNVIEDNNIFINNLNGTVQYKPMNKSEGGDELNRLMIAFCGLSHAVFLIIAGLLFFYSRKIRRMSSQELVSANGITLHNTQIQPSSGHPVIRIPQGLWKHHANMIARYGITNESRGFFLALYVSLLFAVPLIVITFLLYQDGAYTEPVTDPAGYGLAIVCCFQMFALAIVAVCYLVVERRMRRSRFASKN